MSSAFILGSLVDLSSGAVFLNPFLPMPPSEVQKIGHALRPDGLNGSMETKQLRAPQTAFILYEHLDILEDPDSEVRYDSSAKDVPASSCANHGSLVQVASTSI